jgi:hypothetical protein
MEYMERLVSWQTGRWSLSAARGRVSEVLARTRWFGNPHTLPASRLVAPMSDQWMREHESRWHAHTDSM